MKDIYIKAEDLSGSITSIMPKQDFYSIEDIIDALEETIYNMECLKEEYEDYKEYVSGNMKERDHWTASEMAEYYSNER